MISYSANRKVPHRTEASFASTDPLTSKSASIHFLNSSTRAGRYRSLAIRTPSDLRNERAELIANIDGSPVLFRILVEEVPAGMCTSIASADADVHSLLSNALNQVVDRMRESSARGDAATKQPFAESSATLPVAPSETVLCVGPLELDLVDRTAKRGDRPIDLRPREFRLLKYMMQRSDTLLTRAMLFKDVWHYKFVPETNLVDVHMGRLRRKVDASNEAPMIHSIRGAGFVLSAVPGFRESKTKPLAQPTNLATGGGALRSVEGALE